MQANIGMRSPMPNIIVGIRMSLVFGGSLGGRLTLF